MPQTQLVDVRGQPITSQRSVPPIGRDLWTQGATTGAIRVSDVESKPYRYHPWTYACARACSLNVSRLPPVLYARDNFEDETERHPVLERLTKPNSMMTYRTMRQAVTLMLLLPSGGGFGQRGGGGGQSFLVAWNSLSDEPGDFTSGKVPDEVMPFSEEFIHPKFDKSRDGRRKLQGWVFRSPNQVEENGIPLPLESVIRIHLYNPYDVMRGMAPYLAGEMAVDQDAKSDVFNSRLFETDGRIAGALTTDDTLTAEQRRDNIAEWASAYTGLRRRINIAMLDGGLKYQQIGMSQSDMQWLEQKHWARDTLIAVYGMNKIGIGQYENLNFATIREGRRLLWYDTYMPLDELICDAINTAWLDNVEGGRWRLRSDYSKIESLRSDVKDKAQAVQLLTNSGAPFALAARIVGLSVRSDDLKRWPHLEEEPKKGGGFATSTPESAPPKKAVEFQDLPISDETTRVLVQKTERDQMSEDYIERVLKPAEQSMFTTMNRYFVRQRNEILKLVDAWANSQKSLDVCASLIVVRAEGPDPSIFLLGVDEETKTLLTMYKPNAKKQLKLEEEKLIEELGQLVQWGVTDPLVDQYVAGRASQMRKLNNGTRRVVKDAINDAIKQGYDEGWTVREVAKQIKQNVQTVYRVRLGEELEPHGKFDLGGLSSSKTIARTEMGIIASEGRFDAFQQEGIERQEWLTSHDEKVRLSHAMLDTNVVKVGEAFANGLLFPRDPDGDAAEICNCRCVCLAAEEK